MRIMLLLLAFLPVIDCGRVVKPSETNAADLAKQCMDYVFKPANCVVDPAKWENSVNGATTKRLGLYMPGGIELPSSYAPRLNHNQMILDAAFPLNVKAVHIAMHSQWGPVTCGQNLCFACSNNGQIASFDSPKCVGGWRWGCADKASVLMTSEDGEKHCIRFGGSAQSGTTTWGTGDGAWPSPQKAKEAK